MRKRKKYSLIKGLAKDLIDRNPPEPPKDYDIEKSTKEKTRYCVCGARMVALKSLVDEEIYVCVSCNPTIKSIPRKR